MDLSKRQLVAIRNPCFEAVETVNNAFHMKHAAPLASSTLTLNIGME